jgi:WhiB family transcriptional regulator, redox-sensing transcriptional regulator
MSYEFQTPWRIPEDVACAGLDTKIFFPLKGERTKAQEAKAICNTCLHQQACLNFALVNHIEHGIFGGVTSTERRQLLANRRWNF